MEKMAAPILEVLRFHSEDVIVTSSATMLEGLKAGTPYFALGSEINEYYDDEKVTGTRFYTFTYDPALNQLFIDPTAYRRKELMDSDKFPNLYAWYTNRWVTENQHKDYYSDKTFWTQ